MANAQNPTEATSRNQHAKRSRHAKPEPPRKSTATKRPIVALLVTVFASALVMACGNSIVWGPEHHVAIPQEKASEPPENAVVLGKYEAISQSTGTDRAHNIAHAADLLNGIIIMPGATLSLNDTLGDTSSDPEYVEATAFSGSTLVTERGGGICQVASALYVAALNSDIEVVERHPHTMACDYVPLGLDATLAYGDKDLVIRNNEENPVYLSVTANGQSVMVAFHGVSRGDGATYNVYSRAVNMRTVTTEEAASELGLDDLAPQGSATLYDIESYRAKYVDGTIQDTELIAQDTYLIESSGDTQR